MKVRICEFSLIRNILFDFGLNQKNPQIWINIYTSTSLEQYNIYIYIYIYK